MQQIAPQERRVRCLPAVPAPAQRPRPLRGRRGVRAAPPLDPPLRLRLALLPCWSSPDGDRCACPPRQKKRCALPRGASLALLAAGFRRFAFSLDRGEAWRRARAASERSDLPTCRRANRPIVAPSHAAPAPGRCRVVAAGSAPAHTACAGSPRSARGPLCDSRC